MKAELITIVVSFFVGVAVSFAFYAKAVSEYKTLLSETHARYRTVVKDLIDARSELLKFTQNLKRKV